MSQVSSVPSVASVYPHLQPGLCGRLECPHVCSRVCHCPAGQRRVRRLLAERASRRFAAKANSEQLRNCERIRKAGGCPTICNQVGGCFLPRPGDHPSEIKRKVFRAQQAIGLYIAKGGR
jgi:hypothetical protein